MQAPTSTTPRPDDLVPVLEAGVLVDRSASTLRTWVRKGELEGWYEDPSSHNSRLCVSRAALLALAAAKDPNPSRPAPAPAPATAPRPSPTSTTSLSLAVELEAARRVEEALRAQVEAHVAEAAALRGQVEAERRRGDEAREDLAEARARIAALEAEQTALRLSSGLPWWRRLLGGPVAS